MSKDKKADRHILTPEQLNMLIVSDSQNNMTVAVYH